MPGNVLNASATTVFPWELTTRFARVWTRALLENLYPDGHSQRTLLVSTARRRWSLAHRLTATQTNTLRDFYVARQGAHDPFIFYDVYETVPLFTFDPTGVAADGKYIVRFSSRFSLSQILLRGDIPLELIEVN